MFKPEFDEGRDPARLKVRIVVTMPDGSKYTVRTAAVALHEQLWPQDAGQCLKDANVAIVTRIINGDRDRP